MEHHIKVTVITDDSITSTLAVAEMLNSWLPNSLQLPNWSRFILRSAGVMPDDYEIVEAHFRSLSDVVLVVLHMINAKLADPNCNMVDVQKLLEWMRAVNALVRVRGLHIPMDTDTFDNVSASLLTIATAKGHV